MFFRCNPILSLEQSKSAAIAFCVAQIVSFLYRTCIPCSLPSATKVRNSAVLFLISNFLAILFVFIQICRVNKQVQNYFKSLKNSTKGEEKFGFSRDLQLILTCTISNGLWSMTRKSMHFGKYCLKRWAEWCAMARVWAAGAVFVGQKGGGFVK